MNALVSPKGKLSRTCCHGLAFLCVHCAGFPFHHKELQGVTALGSSLWKARHEDFSWRGSFRQNLLEKP